MKNIKVDTTATTPKKSIKRVKGMTLIECIIALAIFGIMAAVMIAGCLHVYNSKKNTDKITKRTSYETPAVANKSTFTGQEATDATPAVPGDVVQGTGSMTIGGATVNYVTYDAVDNNGVPGLGYFVAPGRNSTPTTTTPADDTDDTDDTEEPPVTTATPWTPPPPVIIDDEEQVTPETRNLPFLGTLTSGVVQQLPLNSVTLSPGQQFTKIRVTFQISGTENENISFNFSSDTAPSIQKQFNVNVSSATTEYSVEVTLNSAVTSSDVLKLVFNGNANVSISSANAVIQ